MIDTMRTFLTDVHKGLVRLRLRYMLIAAGLGAACGASATLTAVNLHSNGPIWLTTTCLILTPGLLWMTYWAVNTLRAASVAVKKAKWAVSEIDTMPAAMAEFLRAMTHPEHNTTPDSEETPKS